MIGDDLLHLGLGRGQAIAGLPQALDPFLEQLQRGRALTNLRLHLKKKDGSSITGLVNVSMIPAEGGETHVLGTMVEEA